MHVSKHSLKVLCSITLLYCKVCKFIYIFLFVFCFLGGWVTLRPIVLVDIVGLTKVTDAFGILAFFQGIAMCSGPPFAGLKRIY